MEPSSLALPVWHWGHLERQEAHIHTRCSCSTHSTGCKALQVCHSCQGASECSQVAASAVSNGREIAGFMLRLLQTACNSVCRKRRAARQLYGRDPRHRLPIYCLGASLGACRSSWRVTLAWQSLLCLALLGEPTIQAGIAQLACSACVPGRQPLCCTGAWQAHCCSVRLHGRQPASAWLHGW